MKADMKKRRVKANAVTIDYYCDRCKKQNDVPIQESIYTGPLLYNVCSKEMSSDADKIYSEENLFRRIINSIKDMLLTLYVAITYKNPCKTCIVQACCNDKCEIVKDFEKFFWNLDDHKFQQFAAWSIIWSVCVLILGISKFFIMYVI